MHNENKEDWEDYVQLTTIFIIINRVGLDAANKQANKILVLFDLPVVQYFGFWAKHLNQSDLSIPRSLVVVMSTNYSILTANNHDTQKIYSYL